MNFIKRNKYVVVFTALLTAVLHASTPFADEINSQEELIRMGVFPIVSGVALFKRFAPLKDHIEKELGREIKLETARDFPTFVRRTADKNYDIVITAPHFSVLAADSGDYQIVARPKRNLVSLIVVAKSSKLTTLSQLAGKKIATPPVPALTTRSGKRYLAQEGLKQKQIPTYVPFKSHNAAYQSVLIKDTDAAIVSINAVNKALDKGIPLRIIGKVPVLPAMATLVSTRFSDEFAMRVEKILVAMDTTEEGRIALKKVGFPGYWSARLKDYEPVRPYKPKSANIGKKKKKN